MLKDLGKVVYETADDKETLHAFYTLTRQEGITPALENAYAPAFSMKLAGERPRSSILFDLSGRGDKDVDFVVDNFGMGE